MKRVLQVLGSLQRGGAETMIMNIYRAIDRNKVQFDFLVKERVDIGYEQEVLDMGGRIFHVESARKIGVYNFIREQCRIMVDNGPYVAVHSHINVYSGMTLCAAKMAGIPIRISHSHIAKFSNSLKLSVGRILIDLFSTTRLACGSDAGKALYGQKPFYVIPNAIDIDKFYPLNDLETDKLYEELQVDKTKFNICHIGRFNEQKNHTFLIEMFRLLNEKTDDCVLYLLGNGELMEQVRSQVEFYGLSDKVRFCGSVYNANNYLRVMNAFVLPSRFEGLPVSLIEAQCAGLSCLVSDQVTTEVDLHVDLLQFLQLDESLWVEKVLELMQNRRASKVVGQKEALIERHYDIHSSARDVLKHYGIE